MTPIRALTKELYRKANKQKAVLLQRFFKTGKGQYGEGDVFLGVMVPVQRALVHTYISSVSVADAVTLLKSRLHEQRLTALLLLMEKYRKGDVRERERIYGIYLSHTRWINNWDLVDVTCRDIVGAHLFGRDRTILKKLARSKNLWERRIAVVSTFYFIARGEFSDSLILARMLLRDPHDLIHKAVGWMLREIGKKDGTKLEEFLHTNARRMPRTMLRYAIEKLPESRRKRYLTMRYHSPSSRRAHPALLA